jgi:toxin ParE1/3/4
MLPVVVRPRAEADLENARNWYEERRDGLGREFVLATRVAIEKIRANPERYPTYYRGFRRVLLTRFPYKLFYRIESDRVLVFRALHFKQDHTRYLK